MVSSTPPSLRECRTAARAIRRLPTWSTVRPIVRPRGVTGLRSHAPLSVQLYLAGRRGRLIRHAPDTLAWLQPPREHTETPAPFAVRALTLLDAGWELRGLLPVAGLLVASLVAGSTGARTVGLLLLVAALALVLLGMVIVVVRGAAALLAGRNRLVDVVVGQLKSLNWTVVLLHAPDDGSGAALLTAARRVGDAPHLVLVDRRGVTAPTGPPVRAPGVTITPLSDTHPLLVVSGPSDGLPAAPEGPGRFRGGDLVLLLVGSAVTVAVAAGLVSAQESRRCALAGDCDGVPASYGDAVYWLVSRLLGGDPDGLGALDPGSRLIGVLMTIYGVFVLVNVIGTVVRQRIGDDLRSGQDVVADFAERTRRTPRRPLRRRRRRP